MSGYTMSILPDQYGCYGLINGNDGRNYKHHPSVRREYKLPEPSPQADAAPAEAGPAFYARVRKSSWKGAEVGTFSAFPEYKEDPWDAKIEAARKRAAEIRALKSAVGSKPFKPTAADAAYRLSKDAKPAFTPIMNRSIIFHNVHKPKC